MESTLITSFHLFPVSAYFRFPLISGFCDRMKVFDSPGRDTNLSQASSQQTLVLIYLPRKDGKLS